MDWTAKVQFWAGVEWGLLLFTIVCRPTLGSTQLPIQWVRGALSWGIKWPGHVAENLSPSDAEVKNAWSYMSTPPYNFMTWWLIKQGIHLHGVVLTFRGGNSTFTFLLFYEGTESCIRALSESFPYQ